MYLEPICEIYTRKLTFSMIPTSYFWSWSFQRKLLLVQGLVIWRMCWHTTLVSLNLDIN